MLVGQCATPVPVSPSRLIATSSRCTPWANQTSSPSQPSCSTYSAGEQPYRSRQNDSSSTVSARWVCSRTPCSRAIAAAERISSPVTENGEHGATAICSIASGDGSWCASIAATVPASAVSIDSTTESGGSPPSEAPRSIDPRVGWNRSPIRRAASIVAPSTSPPSRGNT